MWPLGRDILLNWMPREAQCKSEGECVLVKASFFKNEDDLTVEHTRLILQHWYFPQHTSKRSWHGYYIFTGAHVSVCEKNLYHPPLMHTPKKLCLPLPTKQSAPFGPSKILFPLLDPPKFFPPLRVPTNVNYCRFLDKYA